MTDRYGHPRQSAFGRRHASAAATVAYSSAAPAPAQQQQQQQNPPPVAPPPPAAPQGQGHRSPSQDPTKQASAERPAPISGVRRNLFQSQLTRRPTGPGEMAGAGGRLDGSGGVGMGMGMGVGFEGEDRASSSDIVVRDQNGDVELDEPPALVVDDPDEIALDMRQENEKERQRLADAVKHHQINQNSVPAQPEELLEAVKASLRAKVAALAEDNWMYEKEDEPRGV